MPEKKKAILKKIKETVQQVDPSAQVILFGSQARGDSRPESDWDILIVSEQKINRAYKEKIRDVLYYLQLELEIDINSLFRGQKDWEEPTSIPVYNEIKREGIRL